MQTQQSPPLYTIGHLMQMSRQQLDEVFSMHAQGNVPVGDAKGTAIACPGTFWAGLIARFVRAGAWQGKVFSRGADGSVTLQNKVSPLGLPLIVARVLPDQASWLDKKPCIVLDYSKTSLLARKIRDEIREISPKLYLGKVWWGKTRLIDFALELP